MAPVVPRNKIASDLVSGQLQLEHTFKKRLIREAEFTSKKLHLQDKELDAKRQLRSETSDHPPKPSAPPTATPKKPRSRGSMGQSFSSPELGSAGGRSLSGASAWTSWGAPMPDVGSPRARWLNEGPWVSSRFGASYTLSTHPVPHPGSFAAPANGRHAPSSPVRKRAHGDDDADTSMSPGSTLRNDARSTSAGSRSPRKTSLNGVRKSLNGAEPKEDEMAALELLHAETELSPGVSHRPVDRPEVINRLGELMALLGPRYRTVCKEAIWERADKGDMTPFQRRLKKEKELGLVPKNPLGAVLRRDPGEKLEIIAPDPESSPRVAWLAARRRARREDQAALEAELAMGAGGASHSTGGSLGF